MIGLHNGPQLRFAEPKDILTMAEIFADAFGVKDMNKAINIMEVSLEVEPQGCLLAGLGNEAVGLGCIFFYGKLAWIGNMAVRKKFQRRGIGSKIFSKLLEIAGSCGVETIGLDATEVGRKLYKKFGFKEMYATITYSLSEEAIKSLTTSNAKLKLTSIDLGRLRELDREVFGYDRWRVVEAWLRHGGKIIATDKGYALIKGSDIGPLVAESVDAAKTLMSKAILLGGRNIVVPAGNKESTELIQELNPAVKDECTRMALGAPLKGNLSKAFAILHYAKG